ncbi:hypothetical protein L596_015806 [Steinernema carpocapsae]|uniref:MADF domain-containing protein n=1 Tax=Steinernema carpocapsae TaxID=34508 RepID=A0A4U5NGQ4_STECR|nr:hypothetical protein L596_015806 [Steinernema carpocapsae]
MPELKVTDVSDEERFMIIEEFRRRPLFWKVGSIPYKDVVSRRQHQQDIAASMTSGDRIFTEKTIAHVWKNLNDTLRRKTRQRQEELANNEDNPVNWKFWDALQFVTEGKPQENGSSSSSTSHVIVAEPMLESTLSHMFNNTYEDPSHLSDEKLPGDTPSPSNYAYGGDVTSASSNGSGGSGTSAKKRRKTNNVGYQQEHNHFEPQVPLQTTFHDVMHRDVSFSFGEVVADVHRRLVGRGRMVDAANFKKELCDIMHKYDLRMAEE